MAINFPDTTGQATDGSYTYNVAGLVYSWDGTSWRAAGAGASATDRTLFSVTQNAVGTAALSYDSNTGVFSYTPPNLSSFLTAETDPDYSAAPASGITNTNISQWNTAYSWGDHGTQNYLVSGSTSLSTLNDCNTAGATTGMVLTYNASSTEWQAATPPVALASRTTAQVTQSIANNASATPSLTTPKTYALLKIETSHAAWVTLYSDTTSRTADSSRTEYTDPVPGSGVLAEVITGGAVTQLITPGTICFNSSGSNTTYLKVVNKSGSTANVTVTLTYVQLEA